MRIYYGLFTSKQDVIREFAIKSSELKNAKIIYADYDTSDYEGYAILIYSIDDVVYEVHGSHCSCNGLENCWYPEVTSILALLDRPNIPNDAKYNLRIHYKNLLCFL